MPEQMTTNQARVVDPVLTTHALGYREPELIGHELFPYIDVNVHGGKIVDFGDYVTEQIETLRAPGADAAELHIKYGSKSFALETHGLDAVVPREIWNDAQNVPNVQIASRAIERALKPVMRNIEIAQAAIALDPNNYSSGHKVALTAGNKWSDADVDPTNDVVKAVNAIELDSGGTNIVVEIGADVMTALRTNAAIADKIKHTERAIVTEELLAQLWGVKKVVVGRSLKKVGNTRTRIWGKHVVVAHVPNQGAIDEPSFGYTYRLRGTPAVNSPYYRRKNRSWIYDVDADFDAELTMADAGYLIQNVVD